MLHITVMKGRFMYVIWKVLVTRGNPNGLEIRKIVCISLWEDLGILQGELKFKEKANKLKKCYNYGMAHLT